MELKIMTEKTVNKKNLDKYFLRKCFKYKTKPKGALETISP